LVATALRIRSFGFLAFGFPDLETAASSKSDFLTGLRSLTASRAVLALLRHDNLRLSFYQINLESYVQYQGPLKFYKSDRATAGFGFLIRDSDPTINDFSHISALHESGIRPDSLEEGRTRFSYDVAADSKNGRLKAANLRIID
jgi:cold shock CspA family protein